MFRAIQLNMWLFEDYMSELAAGKLSDFLMQHMGYLNHLRIEGVLDLLDEVGGIEGAVGRTFWNGKQWIALLPEMSERGYVCRTQHFDSKGFSSHESHRSWEKALDAIIEFNPIMFDDGALDRLSQTTEWRIGSFTTALIGRINAREVKFSDFAKLREEFIQSLN